MSDSYSPPTSPAYSPNYESDPHQEPYVPTPPEYHPLNEDETHLGSDHSAGSHCESNQEARTYRDPDRVANVTDREPNRGANDIPSELATFPTPTDQHVIVQPNVAQVIRDRCSATSPGYRRLYTTGVTSNIIQRRRERVNNHFRLVCMCLRSLENREVVTDPHDIQQLCLLITRDLCGSAIRQTLHVERATSCANNSDPILLLSFQTADGLAHQIFIRHNLDYGPSDEAYLQELDRLAHRLVFVHERALFHQVRPYIHPLASGTLVTQLPSLGISLT